MGASSDCAVRVREDQEAEVKDCSDRPHRRIVSLGQVARCALGVSRRSNVDFMKFLRWNPSRRLSCKLRSGSWCRAICGFRTMFAASPRNVAFLPADAAVSAQRSGSCTNHGARMIARRRTSISRGQKMAIGPALVIVFWFLFAFFAFGPFDRETPAVLILSLAGAVFLVFVVLLRFRGLVDLETGLYAILFFGILVGLYAIPLRDDLHPDARALNRAVSARHDDRYEYARELFWNVVERFTGPTREYLLQPQKIFLLKSAEYYWEVRGYMPSHLQAQMYRHLLIDSGRFSADEVRYETGRCFNSPHGYVVILHPDREIHADLWAAANIDEYRFGQVVEMPSCDRLAAGEPEGEPFPTPQERAAQ